MRPLHGGHGAWPGGPGASKARSGGWWGSKVALDQVLVLLAAAGQIWLFVSWLLVLIIDHCRHSVLQQMLHASSGPLDTSKLVG